MALSKKSRCKSPDIHNLVSSLYLNPRYSDLTIICQEDQFPAHRNIVCLRSTYFARMCDGAFAEAASGIVQLDEYDPLLIRKMLECLYTGDYTYSIRDLGYDRSPSPEEATPTPTSDTEIVPVVPNDNASKASNYSARFHASMYAYADYFGIDVLRTRAKRYFGIVFMKDYSADAVNRESFAAVLEEVYGTTPAHDRGLRGSVVDTIMKDISNLRGGSSPVLDDAMLRRFPEFAMDVCSASLDSLVNLKEKAQWPNWA
ncbi:BTB/POZ protein [Aspergillus avenaceus]|uniref:BTB/POZ protein n=1 Tax=Aspergillus avenaceus TaxID=36643 RepID=A0A5N6UA65_ASPAV|nr:BTB/POZ protein [Aspergillus avenaceus]